MTSLDGRVAIVTGAGRGTGRALALKLAAEGASVVVNDVSEAPAAETVAEIRRLGGNAEPCIGDITRPEFPDRFVATALERFGGLDIIVNNASYVWSAFIEDMTDEQFQAMIDVNMTAPFRILRAAAPFLKNPANRAAWQRKVVNVSSVLALSGGPTTVNYGSSKAGLIGITLALAREWGRFGINVNAVALGLIETRLGTQGNRDVPLEVGERSINFAIPSDRIAAYTERTALGRAGTPEEAAGAIYLLCLPEADYITGEVVLVTGGQLR